MSGHDRPLPTHLLKSLTKFRQTWGRKPSIPHRTTPSTLGASCVCRYLLAHGHLSKEAYAYPPGQLITPTPKRWFQLDVEGLPFASFIDPTEAYSYAISLKTIDQAVTAVFMTLLV